MSLHDVVATWERRATQERADLVDGVARLVGAASQSVTLDAFDAIKFALARVAIVDPELAAELGAPLVGPLAQAIDHEDRALESALGVREMDALDLANVLACIGLKLPDRSLATLRSWLPRMRMTIADGSTGAFWSAGFAAFALGDRAMYRRHVDVPVGDHPILHELLRSLESAVAQESEIGTTWSAYEELLLAYSRLLEVKAIDNRTLLWIARAVHHHVEHTALGTVAHELHAIAWRLARASAAEAASAEPKNVPRSADANAFPFEDTLRDGTFRPRVRLHGTDNQRLFLGRRVHSTEDYLISVNLRTEHDDPAQLESRLAYRVPGVLELEYIGSFDRNGVDPMRDAMREAHWGLVERLPAGTWLPRALAEPVPDQVRVSRAISLGCSAGKILLAALERDVLLHRVRTELMWVGDRTIVGLTDRPAALFALPRREVLGGPAFADSYVAPEAIVDGSMVDDRALTFTLAALVASWATGLYPFERTAYQSPLEVTSSPHLSLEVDPMLEELLSLGMQRDPSVRPDLVAFVRALGAIVPTTRPRRL